MRQDRKPEAGNQKHKHGEHRVWIFDRHTCSIDCFVLRCGTKRVLTLQLLDFRSSLACIVHLPVPSENVIRRGNKISKSWRGLRFGQIGDANWTALCVARHVNVVTVVGGLFRVTSRVGEHKSAYCRVRQEKTKSNTDVYADCTLDLLSSTRGRKLSATSSPYISRQSHFARESSMSAYRHCTTSSNKSPSPKSCEK
jgi:hypothetical protein